MAITITGAVLGDTEPGSRDDGGAVTFGYRGTIYEVQLSAQDREALSAVFTRYLRAAIPIGVRPQDGDAA